MTTSDDVLTSIRRHAETTYPEECCGLLLGRLRRTSGAAPTTGENEVVAARGVENRNANRRVDRYVIDPNDYRTVDREARERNLDIVGIYHSHPDHPAEPSSTDLEQATFPGYSYVIVSVVDGQSEEMTAWTLAPDRSRFLPENIQQQS